MREREQQQHEEPYWQHEELLGEAPIRGKPCGLRLRIHTSQERYRTRHELVPLSHPSGSRTYVHAQPYILEPEITMTVGLYPRQRRDGAVGEVLAPQWEGMRHVLIGNAQAWAYPQDALVLLWEAFLNDRYRQPDPLQDEALTLLWTGFERLLLRRVPPVARIVTPAWEPVYPDREDWQAFLRSQGYQPINARAFGKEVERP